MVFSDYIISGVEIQCIGHFKLLFSLLRCEGCAKVQEIALEVGAFCYGIKYDSDPMFPLIINVQKNTLAKTKDSIGLKYR